MTHQNTRAEEVIAWQLEQVESGNGKIDETCKRAAALIRGLLEALSASSRTLSFCNRKLVDLESELSDLRVRALPVLPEGWIIHSITSTHNAAGKHVGYRADIYSYNDGFEVGNGHTPAEAVKNALGKVGE